MARSASGQYAANSLFWMATRAGKMERYCTPGTARLVPANKISPKFKREHDCFLSLKLLPAKVKRFFAISLSLWNQKKRQREWKHIKQTCWYVLNISFVAKIGKLNTKVYFKFENLNSKCNQSNDCIFCIYPIRIYIGARAITLAFNWVPFQCSKINKYEDHFF